MTASELIEKLKEYQPEQAPPKGARIMHVNSFNRIEHEVAILEYKERGVGLDRRLMMKVRFVWDEPYGYTWLDAMYWKVIYL